MRPSFFTLTAALAIGFVFAFFPGGLHADPMPASAWSLQNLDGKTVNLSDFKGKVLVLNFWATWCPPCRAEIPDFIELQKEYRGRNVAFVGASVDSVQPTEVAAFVKKAGINYPIVMATPDVAEKYGADQAIPVTIIIDSQGRIVDSHLGMVTKSYVEAGINKLLSAPAAH
jgi:thiol-disulfide isomerase/thioredoxin